MKKRMGFVSNSSSCSFMITNNTHEVKTLRDFAEENLDLVDDYVAQYDFMEDEDPEDLKKQVLNDAAKEDIVFNPRESVVCVFGDEQETTIGRLYYYILRDGGKSKSFVWRIDEMLR